MHPVTAFISQVSLKLDPALTVPLYRQLYEALRGAILSGRLAAGTRLPSTRALAAALGISRNTVANAYEQLSLEEYFEGRVGSGTYVTRSLPDLLHQRRRGKGNRERRVAPAHQARNAGLSRRGVKITGLWRSGRDTYRSNAFRPRLPAFDAFPLDVWGRLTRRRWRTMPADLLTYGDPAGYWPLREIIASYLQEERGVRCEADQIIIVSGTPQAVTLVATVLLDPGDSVWVEDPGNPRARATLMAAEAALVPVPLDAEGLNLEAGIARGPAARMVYVTPAHQYPLGMRMSLARRLDLLQWATQSGSWILEDDYGTEFRTSGLPLAALQSFDDASCVIYTGTFNDVIFPTLRLGYLVVPHHLVEAFITARLLIDRGPPLFGQVVLADFISEHHLDRHIRRMRSLYETRQATLIAALRNAFGSFLEVTPDEAGCTSSPGSRRGWTTRPSRSGSRSTTWKRRRSRSTRWTPSNAGASCWATAPPTR